MKAKCDPTSDTANDRYKHELDTIYVIIGRIDRIHDEKKYYVLHCKDDGRKELKLYFAKHLASNK